MISIEVQKTYSEVYSILDLLGTEYINKLPSSLYNMIKSEKSTEYNPKYSKEIPLEKQEIKKESLSMIALFHLNYWCKSDEEKEEIKQIFKTNAEKHQTELREKYNPDNIFKKKEVEEVVSEPVDNSVAMTEYKESFGRKILRMFNINLFKK